MEPLNCSRWRLMSVRAAFRQIKRRSEYFADRGGVVTDNRRPLQRSGPSLRPTFPAKSWSMLSRRFIRARLLFCLVLREAASQRSSPRAAGIAFSIVVEFSPLQARLGYTSLLHCSAPMYVPFLSEGLSPSKSIKLADDYCNTRCDQRFNYCRYRGESFDLDQASGSGACVGSCCHRRLFSGVNV
jgi:hypothetical protein